MAGISGGNAPILDGDERIGSVRVEGSKVFVNAVAHDDLAAGALVSVGYGASGPVTAGAALGSVYAYIGIVEKATVEGDTVPVQIAGPATVTVAVDETPVAAGDFLTVDSGAVVLDGASRTVASIAVASEAVEETGAASVYLIGQPVVAAS